MQQRLEAAKRMPQTPLIGFLCACTVCPLLISMSLMCFYYALMIIAGQEGTVEGDYYTNPFD